MNYHTMTTTTVPYLYIIVCVMKINKYYKVQGYFLKSVSSIETNVRGN